jgi:hypothetical protein
MPKKNNTLETSLTAIMPFAQRERLLPNIAKYPLQSLLSFFLFYSYMVSNSSSLL